MCEACDYIERRAGRASESTLHAEFQVIWRRRVRRLIESGSWLVQMIESWPWLTYTVGLWSLGHPELCVFGLEPPAGGRLLNVVGDMITEGLRLADGDEISVGAGVPLRAFRVPNPGKVVLQANAFYRRRPRSSVPALQLMYPDAHGVWPWEDACHLFPGSQPMPGEFDATVDPASA